MFGIPPEGRKAVATNGDFTDTRKIRDGIAALEKAANKHANKQPRTINPVALSVTLKIAPVAPDGPMDAAAPSVAELDALLAFGVDTSVVSNSGEAQAMIARLRLRKEQGLCSPRVLEQMMLRFAIPEEKAVLMRAGVAGLVMAGKVPASKFR